MKIITVKEFVERLVPAKSLEMCGFNADSFYNDVSQNLYDKGVAIVC